MPPDLSALDPTRPTKQADVTRSGAPLPPLGPPSKAAIARARVFIAREWNSDRDAIEETARAGRLSLVDLHLLQANYGATFQRPLGGRGSAEELQAAIVTVCQELFPPPEPAGALP